MRKVNWMAKADHEYIPNYKVLQAAFDRNGTVKHIDVDKLIRGKYQDNLEFLQWTKCYWEREGGGMADYDPAQAREGKPVPPWARSVSSRGGGASRFGEKENHRPATSETGKRPAVGASTGPSARPAAKPLASNTGARTTARTAGYTSTQSRDAAASTAAPRAPSDNEVRLSADLENQREEMQDMRITLDAIEKERDYYFAKLRSVEIHCRTLEAEMNPGTTPTKIVADILGILYAESDDVDGNAAAEDADSPLATS
jgi:RP/EB family microtubule-associated protein